jgi:hypothetical protein
MMTPKFFKRYLIATTYIAFIPGMLLGCVAVVILLIFFPSFAKNDQGLATTYMFGLFAIGILLGIVQTYVSRKKIMRAELYKYGEFGTLIKVDNAGNVVETGACLWIDGDTTSIYPCGIPLIPLNRCFTFEVRLFNSLYPALHEASIARIKFKAHIKDGVEDPLFPPEELLKTVIRSAAFSVRKHMEREYERIIMDAVRSTRRINFQPGQIQNVTNISLLEDAKDILEEIPFPAIFQCVDYVEFVGIEFTHP